MTAHAPRISRAQSSDNISHAIIFAPRGAGLASMLKQHSAFSAWRRGVGPISPLAFALLAACGGSGGRGHEYSVISPTDGGGVTPSSDDLEVYVIDGPAMGARIYVDANDNGVLDEDTDTFIGVTDNRGHIQMPTEHRGKLALADVSEAIDIYTGTGFDGNSVYSALLDEVSSIVVISPITTILYDAVMREADMGGTRSAEEVKQDILDRLFGSGAVSEDDIQNPDFYTPTDDLSAIDAAKRNAISSISLRLDNMMDDFGGDQRIRDTVEEILRGGGLPSLDNEMSETLARLDYGKPFALPNAGDVTVARGVPETLDSSVWGYYDPFGNDGVSQGTPEPAAIVLTALSEGTVLLGPDGTVYYAGDTIPFSELAGLQVLSTGSGDTLSIDYQVSDGTYLSAPQSLILPVTEGALAWDNATAALVQDENDLSAIASGAHSSAGDPISYRIIGGADAGQFTIDPDTGELRFTSSPNFEAPTDADGNHVYEVIIEASDGTYGIQHVLNVTVNDLNEAPVWASSSGAVEIDEEGGTLLGTYTATDDDGDSLEYTVTGGADPDLFTIDAASGNLSFLSAPDYENPADDGGDNTYSVEITASDGVNDVSQIITVSVINVNDNVPIWNPANPPSMDENTIEVGTYTATDDDGDSLKYAITGGDDPDLFTIDAASGNLSFLSAPDYENPADDGGDNTYSVEITASDGVNDVSQIITVSVINVNDNVPIWNPANPPSMDENTLEVGTYTATDDDGGSLEYTVTGGADADLFTIDAASGLLSFRASPDYENPADAGGDNTYSVEITASDGKTPITQTITISVTNVNEAPYVSLALPDTTLSYRQAGTILTAPGAFSDPDIGDKLSYSAFLNSGTALPSWLSFDPTTGTLSSNGEMRISDIDPILTTAIKATDTEGLSAIDRVTIKVELSAARLQILNKIYTYSASDGDTTLAPAPDLAELQSLMPGVNSLLLVSYQAAMRGTADFSNPSTHPGAMYGQVIDRITSDSRSLTYLFEGAGTHNKHADIIGSADTSLATLMTGMFYKNNTFNADISNWDVSGVMSFSMMFLDATALIKTLAGGMSPERQT